MISMLQSSGQNFFFSEKPQFLLLKSSTDWVRPAHIMKNHRLYSNLIAKPIQYFKLKKKKKEPGKVKKKKIKEIHEIEKKIKK